jgi:hypothetical protein
MGGLVLLCGVGIFFNVIGSREIPPPAVERLPTLTPLTAPPLTPQPDDTGVTYMAPIAPDKPFALDMPADWRAFPLHETRMQGVVVRSPANTSEITVLIDPEPTDADDRREDRRDYARAIIEDYFARYGADDISYGSFTDSNAQGWLREYYPFIYVGPNGDTWQGRIYIYQEDEQRSLLVIGSADLNSYQNERVIETELDILRSYRLP